jgi:hypothetical protein
MGERKGLAQIPSESEQGAAFCDGGESGIRTLEGPLDPVSCRIHKPRAAVNASHAVAPGTLWHAGSSPIFRIGVSLRTEAPGGTTSYSRNNTSVSYRARRPLSCASGMVRPDQCAAHARVAKPTT